MGGYRIYIEVLFLVFICFWGMGCKREEESFNLLLVNETECRLCGDGEDSLKSIYSQCQGVGLLCLNDWRMVEIQPYMNGHMKDGSISHVWADAYSVRIEEIMDRGITLVHYTSEKGDTLDEDRVSGFLCAACIDKVKGSVRIYGKHEGREKKAVCLVNLSTMRLYGIQQSFQYYMFDDHYVQASCQADRIQLTVFRTRSADLDML